ncbi:MAG: antibiotic biosynthesis monooxygenase [Crocinitomix sp.]|nr:antibiotic biosynthesis monooxygenase [Crocinitomix sp.]
MFAVLYAFKVIPGKTNDFIKGWSGLTKLIYQYENSLGSRLHQTEPNSYIAYAQWPNKATWKNAGNNLPAQATKFRELMKESCSEIKTASELDVVTDLLKQQQYNK